MDSEVHSANDDAGGEVERGFKIPVVPTVPAAPVVPVAPVAPAVPGGGRGGEVPRRGDWPRECDWPRVEGGAWGAWGAWGTCGTGRDWVRGAFGTEGASTGTAEGDEEGRGFTPAASTPL